MNKKLLFTLTLSALLFTSCGQSGSKQDATTTDTTTTEAAAPEKVKIDENDAESLVAAFEQYADQYAAIIDKLNAAKPGSSEFEAASKEMTELSEELQATSEKCQKLAPNFTKEQKQRFLKAAMNPSFRTSFRSLITCRAAQIHTFHSEVPMVVLTNSLIGTEHRSWG